MSRFVQPAFLDISPSGTALSLFSRSNNGFPHPWEALAFAWDKKLKLWRMKMRPAFVNGIPVLAEGSKGWLDFRDRQIAGNLAKSGGAKDEVFSERSESVKFPKDGWTPMNEDPWIPLRFGREIPSIEENAPLGLQQMGVNAEFTKAFRIDSSGKLRVDQTRLDEGSGRRCLALDLFLSKARPGLVGEASTSLDTLLVGQVVDYSVSLQTTVIDSRKDEADPTGLVSRLYQTVKWEPPVARDNLLNRITGDYADQQDDQLKIATIYAVSSFEKQGEKDEGGVDDTWTLLCKNDVFWNLNYDANEIEIPKQFANLSVIALGTIGAGSGAVVAGSILAPINSQMDAIFNAMRTQSPRGRFWSI